MPYLIYWLQQNHCWWRKDFVCMRLCIFLGWDLMIHSCMYTCVFPRGEGVKVTRRKSIVSGWPSRYAVFNIEQIFSEYFDPENIATGNENKQIIRVFCPIFQLDTDCWGQYTRVLTKTKSLVVAHLCLWKLPRKGADEDFVLVRCGCENDVLDATPEGLQLV